MRLAEPLGLKFLELLKVRKLETGELQNSRNRRKKGSLGAREASSGVSFLKQQEEELTWCHPDPMWLSEPHLGTCRGPPVPSVASFVHSLGSSRSCFLQDFSSLALVKEESINVPCVGTLGRAPQVLNMPQAKQDSSFLKS